MAKELEFDGELEPQGVAKQPNRVPVSAEKLKALQVAMDKIDKSYGKGSIMKLGDDKVEEVDVIPTGSIGLNYALGVGGYPRGRIIEIYGPESSGKTTLAIHAIAEAQKQGGIASMLSTASMPKNSALTLTACLLLSPTVVSRRSRLPTNLFAVRLSISSLSTLWLLLLLRLK